MKPKSSRLTLYMICFFLLVFSGLAGYSTYLHFTLVPGGVVIADDSSCDLKLGFNFCYHCASGTGNCSFAQGYYEEEDYQVRSYTDTSSSVNALLPVGFIADNKIGYTGSSSSYLSSGKSGSILAYNFVTEDKMVFRGIKDYGIGISGEHLIAIDTDGQYGVITYDSGIYTEILPFSYDFIYLKGDLASDGFIDSSIYVVMKDDSWQLVTPEGEAISVPFSNPIVDYTEQSVAVREEAGVKVYSLEGQPLLSSSYSYVSLQGKYVGASDGGIFSVYDLDTLAFVNGFEGLNDSAGAYSLSSDASHTVSVYEGKELIGILR